MRRRSPGRYGVRAKCRAVLRLLGCVVRPRLSPLCPAAPPKRLGWAIYPAHRKASNPVRFGGASAPPAPRVPHERRAGRARKESESVFRPGSDPPSPGRDSGVRRRLPASSPDGGENRRLFRRRAEPFSADPGTLPHRAGAVESRFPHWGIHPMGAVAVCPEFSSNLVFGY